MVEKGVMGEAVFHEGRPDRAVVVLVHGFGMSREFWFQPEQCPVLGGMSTVAIFLGDRPGEGEGGRFSLGATSDRWRGLWYPLAERGFSLAAWSQEQSLGPVAHTLAELAALVAEARRRWPGREVYLIGHSRGGLVARKYVLTHPAAIQGLVTVGSPHLGTGLAAWADTLHPLGKVLHRLLPLVPRSRIGAVVARITAFLKSTATRELAPGAEFVRSLDHPLPEGMRALSFGGTSPDMITLYLRPRAGGEWRAVSCTELLGRVLPAKMRPPELTPGEGDGLVSAESARLPGAPHYDLPANHVALSFAGETRRRILEFLAR